MPALVHRPRPRLDSTSPLRTAEPPLRKSQILVVDDEALYGQALERIFHRIGHTVRLARDASEAMEIVSTEPIDLVFTDIQMPGLSGLELVRRIHEHDPDIPCIVMTGYASPESSIEALRAGKTG